MIEQNKLTKAKYSADLNLNGFILSCSVLEDGTRIFAERSLANAFGIKGGGAFWEKKRASKDGSAFLPEYLSANYLKPFISNELTEKLSSAFEYLSTTNTKSRGVDATVLADICDVFIQAKNADIKNKNLLNVADAAYKMIKAFAKVGIIALIDEATGYQYDREKYELQAILQLFISNDILEWQQTFHLGFYKEIFRLWNVPFTAQNIRRKPPFIGMLTNELIYKNLPKGSFVLKTLKDKTPKTEAGNYKARLFQSLTPFGREELKKVLYSVESLAVISENKTKFRRLVEDRYGQRTLQFPNWDEIEEDKQPITLNTFDQQLKGLLSVPPPKREK